MTYYPLARTRSRPRCCLCGKTCTRTRLRNVALRFHTRQVMCATAQHSISEHCILSAHRSSHQITFFAKLVFSLTFPPRDDSSFKR